MRIRTKATLWGALSVVTSIAVVSTVSLVLIRSELTRQAHAYQDAKMRVFHELLSQKGEAKVVDGKLTFGSYVANNNFDIVDKLSSMTGGTATIFQGETRVSTSVLKDDGTRAVGTPLVGVAKDIVINRGQTYRGEADILGTKYFTAYDPLIDAEGRTFGVLYVGVKQSEFFRSFQHLALIATAVAAVLGLAFSAVTMMVTSRLLGRLSSLAKAADAVSIGEDLDTPLVQVRQDEIGELSKAIDRLRESMRAALKRLESSA